MVVWRVTELIIREMALLCDHTVLFITYKLQRSGETVSGIQQIHPVIYLLMTVTVSGIQQIHPVIYLLMTVIVSGIQQIHPVIYLLMTVTVNGIQQIHPVDISPNDSHC
jgi:hypothetical protein